MTEDYWTKPGHSTMPRIVELADWLTTEKGFENNLGYGRTFIEETCAEFDRYPGAFMALINYGCIRRDSEEHFWRWHYHPIFAAHDSSV